MKKLNNHKKKHNQRLQLKKANNQLIKANLKKHRKLTAKKSDKKTNNTIKKVLAPEEFGLINQENRDFLLEFLNKINYHLSQGYNVNICFDNTRRLLPCGTIWATAKIECLLDLYPNKISCSYPTDNVVEQLFQHIGLLKKLGKAPRKEISSDSVRFWHYVCGRSTDDVSQFKALLQSISLTEDTRSGLFESMSEAVTNTVQHAYKVGQPKEWWMFAQHKEGALTVAICDLGIGIPISLREKPELKEFLSFPMNTVKKRRDTALIEIAVESTRSKTKLPHRGKGLRDMLDLVKNGTVGGFRIFSKKGAFNYSASIDQESGIDYKTAINGTIIQWQLSLDSNHEQ